MAITAADGDPITNTVQITTSTAGDQGDPSDRESEWNGTVQANATHLNVGKDSWTHDPAPDTDFVFYINVCNNGSTASSELTLTDTLPSSLTVDSWWGQNEGWVEESMSAQELVLSRPTIPGNWCGEVYLRVHLADTVQQGDEICNTAVIAALSDIETDDNEAGWCGNVNDPHTNLGIQKGLNWAQLTPGGQLNYHIDYWNGGNTPVAGPILITDTLPANTTFNNAWQDGVPFPPSAQPAGKVVWEISGLDNGYSGYFDVLLDIDAGASPGTVLTNTIEISPQPDEDDYDDNEDTHVETLYATGPNLRVEKHGNWHGHGEGHNAWYDITIQNVGDETVQHVTITDTYPISMTLDGDPWPDWSQVEDYTRNDAEHWFSLTFDEMGPGYRHDFGFNTLIPGSGRILSDLIFTNTVEIEEAPDEPIYTDNIDIHELPSCTPPPLDVSISVDGSDIVLSWTDVGTYPYEVWWSDDDPYFAPGGDCGSAPFCMWADSGDGHRHHGAAGGPGLGNTYIVRGWGQCGVVSDPSGRAAEFVYDLEPGS